MICSKEIEIIYNLQLNDKRENKKKINKCQEWSIFEIYKLFARQLEPSF